jgi:hypothetical protein
MVRVIESAGPRGSEVFSASIRIPSRIRSVQISVAIPEAPFGLPIKAKDIARRPRGGNPSGVARSGWPFSSHAGGRPEAAASIQGMGLCN